LKLRGISNRQASLTADGREIISDHIKESTCPRFTLLARSLNQLSVTMIKPTIQNPDSIRSSIQLPTEIHNGCNKAVTDINEAKAAKERI
jgi:hypothetical protein